MSAVDRFVCCEWKPKRALQPNDHEFAVDSNARSVCGKSLERSRAARIAGNIIESRTNLGARASGCQEDERTAPDRFNRLAGIRVGRQERQFPRLTINTPLICRPIPLHSLKRREAISWERKENIPEGRKSHPFASKARLSIGTKTNYFLHSVCALQTVDYRTKAGWKLTN